MTETAPPAPKVDVSLGVHPATVKVRQEQAEPEAEAEGAAVATVTMGTDQPAAWSTSGETVHLHLLTCVTTFSKRERRCSPDLNDFDGNAVWTDSHSCCKRDPTVQTRASTVDPCPRSIVIRASGPATHSSPG